MFYLFCIIGKFFVSVKIFYLIKNHASVSCFALSLPKSFLTAGPSTGDRREIAASARNTAQIGCVRKIENFPSLMVRAFSEVCLSQWAKDDTDYDRRHREFCLVHKVSEEATEYHYKHIVHGIVISICTDKCKCKDDRDQDFFWNIYNFNKYTNQWKAHKTHNYIGQKQSDKDCIYRTCLLLKSRGPGCIPEPSVLQA